MKNICAIIILSIFILLSNNALAQEFRLMSKIPTPDRLPEGAIPLDSRIVIPRAVVEKGLRTLFSHWNTARTGEMLHDDFYDKQRFVDNLNTFIPRDATLRVLSIQNQQILRQYQLEGEVITELSVTARTQIEFNDTETGFNRLPGTNEYILEIKQKGD